MATDGQTEVLAGAQSVLLYSTNGVDWLPTTGGHNENTITYHSVVWGGGKWVCFGRDTGWGTFLLLSTDGKAWAQSYLKDTLLNGATCGDGRFVGVGDYGIWSHPPDGVTWQREPAPLSDRLMSVTFHQGWYVATVVPARGDTVEPGILASTNVVEWVAGPVQVRRGRGLRASGTSAEALWVAGDDGVIFRAGSIQAPSIRSSGLTRPGSAAISATSPSRISTSWARPFPIQSLTDGMPNTRSRTLCSTISGFKARRSPRPQRESSRSRTRRGSCSSDRAAFVAAGSAEGPVLSSRASC